MQFNIPYVTILLGAISIQCSLLADHNPSYSPTLANLSVVSINSGHNNNKTVELNWTNPPCPGICDIANTVYYLAKDEQESEAKKELADGTRHQITDLLPWTTYVFYVKSCFETADEHQDKFQNCSQSEKVEFLTHKGTPSEVLNFTASHVHVTSVELVWIKPEYPNGPIDGYSLFQMEGEFRKLPARGTENNLRISDLKPYSVYVFHIYAFNYDPSQTPNRMRMTGPGTTLTIETNYFYPSTCRNLTVEFDSYTSVRISWEPPLTPNGPSVGYMLSYARADNPYQIIVTQDLLHRTYTTVEKLDYYTNYIFGVRAYNYPKEGSQVSPDNKPYDRSRDKMIGPFSKVNYRTDPWCPSEPQRVHVEANKNGLMVAWFAPLHPKGPIDGYIIGYEMKNPMDQNEKDSNVWRTKRINQQNRYLRYTLDNLIPWREYTISITALNLDKRKNIEMKSKEVIVSGFTRIGVPMAPTNVEMQERDPATVSVSWNTTAPETGPTIYLVYLDQCPVDSMPKCIPNSNWKLKAKTSLLDGWNYSLITFDDVIPMSYYRARVVSQTEAGYNFSDYSDTLCLFCDDSDSLRT